MLWSGRSEPPLDFVRQWPAGLVGALEDLPVIPIAGAILQLPLELDRRPLRRRRGGDDGGRRFDLVGGRRESLDDRPDLVGVDAPHPGVAELAARAARRLSESSTILEFRHVVVR